MKKTLLSLLIVSSMLVACNHDDDTFKTYQYDEQRFYMLTADEQMWPGGEPLPVDNIYSIQWPASNTFSPDVTLELLQRCFHDSTANSLSEATNHWLSNTWFYDEDSQYIHKETVDSIGNPEHYSYGRLEGKIVRDSNLATFIFTTETFMAFAAHGNHTATYTLVDLDTKQIVHLNDLVDTAQLGEVIVRAIEDLTVNKDVYDCLFDEFRNAQKFPVPSNFFIDSTRSCINLVYGLYDIAPYACGIQTVVMPIFWLSKHIPLTPYCKELFGEGCSID